MTVLDIISVLVHRISVLVHRAGRLSGDLGQRKTSTNALCEQNAWLDHQWRVLGGMPVNESYVMYCDAVDECNEADPKPG